MIFAHSNHSEQSLWYERTYWDPFVNTYSGDINLMKINEDPGILCQLDIKAFPVVRIVYNNTFGRVIQLEELMAIKEYKFTPTTMPEQLATFFHEINNASMICTFQVKLFLAVESVFYTLQQHYKTFRQYFPTSSLPLYGITHDIPIIIALFYFIGRKVMSILE